MKIRVYASLGVLLKYAMQRAWAMSNYLNISSSSSCGLSRGSRFATGMVSRACLQCICLQESNCHPVGCNQDGYSLSCGYFQIKEPYWQDCGRPGASWESCADDNNCSSQCVQNYMSRYGGRNGCQLSCEGFARLHNGGPNGCKYVSTIPYLDEVQRQSGCSNVQ